MAIVHLPSKQTTRVRFPVGTNSIVSSFGPPFESYPIHILLLAQLTNLPDCRFGPKVTCSNSSRSHFYIVNLYLQRSCHVYAALRLRHCSTRFHHCGTRFHHCGSNTFFWKTNRIIYNNIIYNNVYQQDFNHQLIESVGLLFN